MTRAPRRPRRLPRLTAGVLAACLGAGAAAACAGTGRQETAPTSTPTPSTGVEDLFGSEVAPREEGAFGLDRWSPVEPAADVPAGEPAPAPQEPAFSVSYPAGSVSPSASREHDAPEGGMQVFLPLVGEPMDEAHLRYWVRLPADFEFVKGGKLPGFYGGEEVSGGEEPDGTDGFSTRLMWRADGEGEVYLYAPDESGTSLGRGDWTWPTGRWTCVEQHVVLNDPDDPDGSVTVRLDGQEVFSEDGMRYRTVDALKVEGIFFSTFFGGADPSWAPSTDQHADFAGFRVSPDPIGCDAA